MRFSASGRTYKIKLLPNNQEPFFTFQYQGPVLMTNQIRLKTAK